MKHKFIASLAAVILLSALAFSQANSSEGLPAAPGTANDPPAPALNPNATKVATINVEQAIFASNEGQRDLEALGKKFEPKRTELQSKKEAIDALKKQATATGLTEEKKADLQREIDQKQKQLERDAQDAQEDFNAQQNEVGQRIFQKMGPVIMKYAQDNALGIIIDTSTPWPNGPILWANPASMDITKPIVDAYNVQSGVAAPPRPAGSSGNTGAKPPVRTAPASKPATTTPPAK